MIKIAAVGKIREKALQQLIAEYQKRLSGYDKVVIVEVPDEAIPLHASEADKQRVLDTEGRRLLAQLKPREYVILLDLHGTMLDSLNFAGMIDAIRLYQSSDICFVIGGSLGLSPELIARADRRLCLSPLTFPHQLTRLILLEQIYRAFKINNNETYHK